MDTNEKSATGRNKEKAKSSCLVAQTKRLTILNSQAYHVEAALRAGPGPIVRAVDDISLSTVGAERRGQ